MGIKEGPLAGVFRDLARFSAGAMGLGVLSVLFVATHLAVTGTWESPAVRESSGLASRGADGACKCCHLA